MSTYALARGPRGILGAFESSGAIRFTALRAALEPRDVAEQPVSVGEAAARKHPSIACGPDGSILVAWIEGLAWGRGGALAWQLFEPDGKPSAVEHGRRDGVPAWSLVQAVALPGGRFVVIY